MIEICCEFAWKHRLTGGLELHCKTVYIYQASTNATGCLNTASRKPLNAFLHYSRLSVAEIMPALDDRMTNE
jgi:hypothetical protein